jgi:hypothetical protein
VSHHHFATTRHQWQVLTSPRRLVFLGGGVGTGKTTVGTLWALRQAQAAPPDALGLICANSYAQLYDTTLRTLYRHCAAFGIPIQPESLPGSYRPLTLQVGLGGHWRTVLCRSLEQYALLSGLEVAWWWADEVWQTQPAAIELLLARLRDPRHPAGQALLTTTLDDPASWLYDLVVTRYQEAWMEVVYATTCDNAAHLPPGYIESLRALYSPRLFERMVLARWVALEQGLLYPQFDRQRHAATPLARQPGLPLWWSLDFNLAPGKPMSSVVAQLVPGQGPDGRRRPELHVLDELVLETSDTREVVAEFIARGWGAEPEAVRVCGDAAGRARDSRSRQTDYSLLAQAGFVHQEVPASNPPLRDRHNAVNALLGSADGDVRLRLDPRCRVLLRGLETVRLKPGSQYLEEERYEQHVTTALGYLVAARLPCRPPARPLPRFWK